MVTLWHSNKSRHLEGDSCTFLISLPPTGFLQPGVALFVCLLLVEGLHCLECLSESDYYTLRSQKSLPF